MQVPINTGPLSILGSGGQQPEASPQDFGAQVGAAQQGFGSEMSRAGDELEKVAEIRNQIDNNRWVNDSMTQVKNAQNKWMADPENHSKESFADDYQKIVTQTNAEYLTSAPNRQARDMFQNEYNEFSSSRLDAAYSQTSRVKVQNLQQSVLGQIDGMTSDYRLSRDIPGIDANQDLVDNLKKVHDTVDKSFGEIAPAVAKEMHDKATIDATYAALDYSPSLARKILDSGNIEGHTYHAIEDAIDHAENSRNAVDRVTFDQQRSNWLTQVKQGVKQDKIPNNIYQSYLPRNEANALKLRDDMTIDTFNKANNITSKISSYNRTEQINAVGELVKNQGKNPDTAAIDADVLTLVNERVQQNLELMQKDPAGYLAQNNPVLKSALNRLVGEGTDGPSRAQYRGELDKLLIRYQGAPATERIYSFDGKDIGEAPLGGEDGKQFLNLPKSQISVLSAMEAQQFADQINHGSPKDALKTIASIVQQHPDENTQAIAFNDMVKLPNGRGIKGQYWAAYMNRNAPWVDDYLGAIQNSEVMKAASGDKMKDFEDSLNANPGWKAFAASMPSDNFQRESLVGDFKDGITTYALGLAQLGMSPKNAITTSVNRVIKTELGATSVNGQTLQIPRDAGDKKMPRTDIEIADIGRRLTFALNYISPDVIGTKDEYGRDLFPGLNIAGSDEVKRTALRDAINSRGTFQMSPDGKSASLYYHDGMNHFEVRDKDNHAFVINLKDLPHFNNIAAYDSAHPMANVNDIQSDIFLYDQTFASRTNWPMKIPPFMQMLDRKTGALSQPGFTSMQMLKEQETRRVRR